MPVIALPASRAPAWMRNSLLVAALAEAGEDGVEPHVPGATLAPGDAPLLLRS